VQEGLRMYFIGLCILVYAAPVISIAAAAAACVLLIQIIALPRNYFMLRDTESCDFFIDDCRSIFELFVNIIGTVPAVIVALATFPLVASLGVIHYLDSSVWRVIVFEKRKSFGFASDCIIRTTSHVSVLFGLKHTKRRILLKHWVLSFKAFISIIRHHKMNCALSVGS
jgi:hypothetical protein